MKFHLSIILLVFSILGWGQGIQFEQGTFNEIADKAASEDKLIFMDVYTTWCGPCKRLNSEVFSDSQVGAFFNQHFINYKVDAEKGEGIAISTKYKVGAYPTLLFLTASGEINKRITGFRPSEPFLDEVKTIIDPDHQPVIAERYQNDQAYRRELEEERKKKLAFAKLLLQNKEFAQLHQLYAEGNRAPRLMQDYLLFREKLNIRDKTIIKEYNQLEIIDDALNLKHAAIKSLDLDYAFDPLFDEMVQIMTKEGKQAWNNELGKVINKSLGTSINQSFASAVTNQDTSALKILLNKHHQIMKSKEIDSLEQADELRQMELTFYASTKLNDLYIKKLRATMEILMPRSLVLDTSMKEARKLLAEKIHLAIESLPVNISNPSILKEGLPWAEKTIELYPHPDMYAPYIQMLFLLKENNQANDAMKKGMILGKRKNLSTDKLFKAFSSIRNKQKKQVQRS